MVTSYHGTDQPDHIRTWRGQRYVTWKCSDCGRDFYAEEPPQGIPEEALDDDKMVDDEDALSAAEEEVKREADNEGDHRYRPGRT